MESFKEYLGILVLYLCIFAVGVVDWQLLLVEGRYGLI